MCKVWILEFGDFGFWILGILDFGDLGFWRFLEFGGLGILDWQVVTKFWMLHKKRRLCTPTRVGGLETHLPWLTCHNWGYFTQNDTKKPLTKQFVRKTLAVPNCGSSWSHGMENEVFKRSLKRRNHVRGSPWCFVHFIVFLVSRDLCGCSTCHPTFGTVGRRPRVAIPWVFRVFILTIQKWEGQADSYKKAEFRQFGILTVPRFSKCSGYFLKSEYLLLFKQIDQVGSFLWYCKTEDSGPLYDPWLSTSMLPLASDCFSVEDWKLLPHVDTVKLRCAFCQTEVCDIPLLLSKAIYYGYSDPTISVSEEDCKFGA